MYGGGLWIQRLEWKVLQLGKTKGQHHVELGERLQSQFISKAPKGTNHTLTST